MKFSNQQYDILKKIALLIAPVVTFIGAVCVIWGVPYSEQITATLAALESMLGALLGISTRNYRADKLQDNFNMDEVEALYEVEYEDQTNNAEQ